MTWEHRGELRADPGIAPGGRNIDPPKRRSIWPSIAVVAAASTFGGVIWYAYHNGREAAHSGAPPLVKAETTPVKVKPTDPGGQEIPYQDSTVYDRLEPNGQKPPVAEKILPPPEEPIVRQQAAAQLPPPPVGEAAPAVTAGTESAPPPPQYQQQAAPLPQAAQAPQLPDAGAPTALAPASGGIVIQPPPPLPRPVQVVPPPKPAVVAVPQPELVQPAPAKPAKPTKPAPDSIAALISGAGAASSAAKAEPKLATGGGSYHLQLSAVRNADAVPEEWARLKKRFPELASLRSSTNKIDVAGKGTFYRVEAGPLDEAAAKSSCTRLRGEGLGCIVVKH